MYKVAALYKFTKILNPFKIHNNIRSKLKNHNVNGTILVGEEGINGTISSNSKNNLDKAIEFISKLEGFKNLEVKYSFSEKNPFIRLKVKLKKEIVTIGDTSVDPTKIVGEYVSPAKWNELIDNKDTIIIDTRNNYEYSIGTFKNSLNPKTSKFREFPNWIKEQKFTKEDKKHKNIAMFCTGGIRCEKASSLMKAQGFDNVFHLKGGILKYFEDIPEAETRWQGECFVFDNRVAIEHELSAGSYILCNACGEPLSKVDISSHRYKKGIHCPLCFDNITEEKIQKVTERQKQIELAKLRGEVHIGE